MPNYPQWGKSWQSPGGILGLLWVWSAPLWLLAAMVAWWSEWYLGAGVLLLRLILTMVLGVGLCAGEIWAWAEGFCLAILHLSATGILFLGALATLLFLPAGTLSWKPVFFGLTTGRCLDVAIAAGIISAASVLTALLLWRSQSQFDLPYRRPFTTLVRLGLLPALGMFVLDALLLLAWWVPSG